jgi:hypothetical protein
VTSGCSGNPGETSHCLAFCPVASTTRTNDDFADAVVLAPGGGTTNGTNVGATMEPGEPEHVVLATGASIWFRWTAPIDGFVTVDTFGSNFDTALAMYTGTAVNALALVAANNNDAGVQSRVSNVPVTAGVTYSIAVDGYFGALGLVTLNWAVVEQFDFTPPVITLWSPLDGTEIPQHDVVFAGYDCFDPIPSSGLVTCAGNVPPNTPLDTSVPGEYTFTVTATDGEGNLATATADYTVLANPENDDFVDALVLDTEGTTSGTNVGATMEPSEPMHAQSLAGASVWFRWTAPTTGFISVDTVGSNFDTVLAIYTGTSVDELTEIDSNDNAVGPQSALHDVPVSEGTVYSIVVAGADDDDEWGDYTLTWSFLELNDVTSPVVALESPADGGLYFVGTTVFADYACIDETLGSGIASCTGDVADGAPIDTSTAGPQTFTVTATDNVGNDTVVTAEYTVQPFTNDDFANALPIEGTGSLVATNDAATKETGEPDHADDAGGASVWFRWTAGEDGFLSVDTLFSDFDTTLAVYSGTSVDALTELGANDNSLGSQSRVRDIPVTAGQTYHIAVDGAGGARGQIVLSWVEFTGPTFAEITPANDPLWVTDEDHDFWLNAAAPADVDGDGDLDLAAIGFFVEYNVSAEDRLVVFMNEGPGQDGNWSFSTQDVPLNGLFTNQSDLAWGDFDGDGDPDLVVGAEGATELYRNDAGTLVPIETELPGYNEDSNYTGAYDLRSLSWADYDNDSDLDLLIPSTFDPPPFAFGTALMRNDGPDGSGGWTFTQVDAQIDGAVNAQTAWADEDGDGDLDLFMANVDNFFDTSFVRTYRNDGGVFESSEPIGNLVIEYGLGDRADYDGDGDLDILIVGLIQDLDGDFKTVLRIYQNVDGVYLQDTVVESNFFPWLDLHAATWADYDSDGDVDILLTGSFVGEEQIEGKSEVYVNDGGTFIPLGRDLPAPVDSAGRGGAFTWFDVDGDEDLDYFVAGAYFVPNGNGLVEAQMHLYRNDGLVANDAPEAPTGLTATEAGGSVTLSWNPAEDDATPPDAITYDLIVRRQSEDGGLMAVRRRLPEPGNLSAVTSWSLRGLEPGAYVWALRAVDSAYNGSAAAASTFTIEEVPDGDADGIPDDADNCTLISNAGQRDSNGDGFGNRCDPDLDNDGIVNFVDLGVMKSVFFTNDRHADLNGDRIVNFVDLGILKSFFFQAPGPSGIVEAGS